MRRRPNVGRYARRGNVQRLGEVLGHRDRTHDRDGKVIDLAVGYRLQAVQALAGHGGAEAANLVSGATRDPAPSVRAAALDALAAWPSDDGASEALRALASAAAQEEGSPDGSAGRGARLLHDKAGEPGLASLLLDSALSAPQGAAELSLVLAELVAADPDPGEEDRAVSRLVAELDGERSGQAGALLGGMGSSGVEALIDALDHGTARREVVHALGLSLDRRATPVLANLLSEPDPKLRRAAVVALDGLSDPRAIEPLMVASDDDDLSVRRAAIDAVNRLGAVAVVFGVAASVRAQVDALTEVVKGSAGPEAKELEAGIEQESAAAMTHIGSLLAKWQERRESVLDQGPPPTADADG